VFVDVNGDSVWIYEGDQRTLYSVGMTTTKNMSKFVAGVVNALNKLNKVKGAGSEVVDALVKSESNYNYRAGDKSRTEGVDGKAGADIYLKTTTFDDVTHETFHGYQSQMGTGGQTYFAEVEAYAYNYLIDKALKLPTTSRFGQDNNSGMGFQQEMERFVENLDDVSHGEAARGFQSGSVWNMKGEYNDPSYTPFDRNSQNIIRALFMKGRK